MAVSKPVALEWEEDVLEDIVPWPIANSLHNSELWEAVIEYFATKRTMEWNARLSDYYSSLAWREHQAYRDQNPPWLDIDWQKRARELDEAGKKLVVAERDMPEMDEPEMRIRSIRRRRIGTDFHGFLSLPREIRDMVYRYLVAPGTHVVFYRGERLVENARGQEYDRYQTLGEDLLRYQDNPQRLFGSGRKSRQLGVIQGVSKQVHLEAMRVCLRENRFIFPAGDHNKKMFWDCGRSYGLDQLASTMRDVSYAFDMRDSVISDFANLNNNVDGGSIDIVRPAPRERILELLHDNKEHLLKDTWFSRIYSMKEMKLDRLQLAFDEAYCGFGCCRTVEWLCKVLVTPSKYMLSTEYESEPEPGQGYYDPQVFEWGCLDLAAAEKDYEEDDALVPSQTIQAPRVIEVFGWRNDEEKDMIENKLGLLKSVGTEQIRFLGKSLAEKEAEWDGEWHIGPA